MNHMLSNYDKLVKWNYIIDQARREKNWNTFYDIQLECLIK